MIQVSELPDALALRLPADIALSFRCSASVCAPDVSIVLPVYNRPQLVSEAIKSVLDLDECRFELLVVDDCSTQSAVSEAQQFADPRLTIVRLSRNAGANVARNVGIALARSDLVAFLDSDDLYYTGRIARPLEILRSHPDIGVAISSFEVEKQRHQSMATLPDRKLGRQDLHSLIARYVLPPTTSGLTIRRDVLLAVSGFDPDLKRIQDRDLILRIASIRGGATISSPLWRKRWQDDGISSLQETYCRSLIEFVAKHDVYSEKERATRDYLLVRHLFQLLFSGRPQKAARDFRLARDAFELRYRDIFKLLHSYVRTRNERRDQKSLLTLQVSKTNAGSQRHTNSVAKLV